MGHIISGENENGFEVEEDLCSGFATMFTIKSGKNMIVRVCSYGATLLSVKNRPPQGYKFEELTLNR